MNYTDQADIDEELDNGPIHVVEEETFTQHSTDWSSASGTQTYSNTITPEDGGTETVSGTITTIASSSGSKLDSTYKTINGTGSQATRTEQTSEVSSGSSARTVTDEGTYTFSGIPENGNEYSGSGSFLETDTSSGTTSFRFNSNVVTDADGKDTGIETTTQAEIDTWDYVRTDADSVSTGNSPATEVNLVSESSGTKTLHDVRIAYLYNGSETADDVATSDVHSSTTLSETGPESNPDTNTHVTSDDVASSSRASTGPHAFAMQASQEMPAATSSGSPTDPLAAARAAVPLTSAAASGLDKNASSDPLQILRAGSDAAVSFGAGAVEGFFSDGLAGDFQGLLGLAKLAAAFNGMTLDALRLASDYVTGGHSFTDDKALALDQTMTAVESFGAELKKHGPLLVLAIMGQDRGAFLQSPFVRKVADFVGEALKLVVDELIKANTDPKTIGRIAGFILYQAALTVGTAGAGHVIKAGKLAQLSSKVAEFSFLANKPQLLAKVQSAISKADDVARLVVPGAKLSPADEGLARLEAGARGPNSVSGRLRSLLDDYWAHSSGITVDEARKLAKAHGFEFEIGRVSRFENARNSVVIGKADLRGGQVNRILLAEEIQHGLDRATLEASKALRRGLTNEHFHAELFQRIVDGNAAGKFQFLTSEDLTALRGWIAELGKR